jgi:Mce-associated membrane protein
VEVPTDSQDEPPAEDTADDVPTVKPRGPRRFRGRRVAVGAAAVLLCALLGLSGFMAWKDHGADQTRQREAEAAAVARQGVVNIMSLDFTNAQGDIQRVLDSATGKFKEDFESESEYLIEALESSKVVTEVTVSGVAVESSSEDAAVVLVSAKSQASNAQDDRRDPQQFRVAVTLARDSGALKVSQVDFL